MRSNNIPICFSLTNVLKCFLYIRCALSRELAPRLNLTLVLSLISALYSLRLHLNSQIRLPFFKLWPLKFVCIFLQEKRHQPQSGQGRSWELTTFSHILIFVSRKLTEKFQKSLKKLFNKINGKFFKTTIVLKCS